MDHTTQQFPHESEHHATVSTQ